MLLDCRSEEPNAVPLSDSSLVIVVTNSNVKHKLAGSQVCGFLCFCIFSFFVFVSFSVPPLTPSPVRRGNATVVMAMMAAAGNHPCDTQSGSAKLPESISRCRHSRGTGVKGQ